MAEWHDIVLLDRKFVVASGTYSSSNTTWSLGITDNTIDTVVLGPGFGSNSGKIVTVSSSSGTVTATGVNYSADEVCIGRAYTKSIELSQFYVRGRDGVPDFDSNLTYRRLSVMYHRTGFLRLKATQTNHADRTKELDVDPINERGFLRLWVRGDSSKVKLLIENDKPKPSTVSAIEMDADFVPRDGGG